MWSIPRNLIAQITSRGFVVERSALLALKLREQYGMVESDKSPGCKSRKLSPAGSEGLSHVHAIPPILVEIPRESPRGAA